MIARTLRVCPLPLALAPWQLPCARPSPLYLLAIVDDARSAHPQAQLTARAHADELPAGGSPLPRRHHWDGRRRARDQRQGLHRVLFGRPNMQCVSRVCFTAGAM